MALTQIPQILHPSVASAKTNGGQKYTIDDELWRWLNQLRRGLEETTEVVRDIINVKDPRFGAAGNGATLDDDAIQAAIEFGNAQGGGVLYFPPGVYQISRPIVFDDNGFGFCQVRVWGAGMYTSGIRCNANPANGPVFSGTAAIHIHGSISFSDFFINGNQKAPIGIVYDPPIGIDGTVFSAPSLFQRIQFALCATSGFLSGSQNGFGGQHTLRDCFFNTCGGYAIDWNNGGQGNMLEDTIVLGGTLGGLHMSSVLGSAGANHNEGQCVRGCAFLTANNQPPLAIPCPGVVIDNGLFNVFSDNVIEGPGPSSCRSVWKRDLGSNHVGPLHFTNNWFGSGCDFRGSCSEIGLLDNSFPGGAPLRFICNNPGPSVNHTIIGNKFTGDGQLLGTTYRVTLTNQRNVIVSHNTLSGENRGFHETSTDQPSFGSNQQIWVFFNFFSQAQSSFNLAGGTGVTFGLNSP